MTSNCLATLVKVQFNGADAAGVCFDVASFVYCQGRI